MMKVVSSYPDGMFNWVDLSTPDMEGAKAFYTNLFGWDARDRTTNQDTIYTMFSLEGQTVAGMSPAQSEESPAFWASYVKHSDVDAATQRATEAGGEVIMPPMDVMSEGRMAFIKDAAGAAFGVWQPKNHIGAALVNTPGALVWNELQTQNPTIASKFYEDVFGWQTTADDTGYMMIQNGERVQAAMIDMSTDHPDMPPHWAVYFMVADIKASTDKVEQLGGKVLAPNIDAGEMGAFSMAQDPQGGMFVIMEFKGEVDSPP
ncbi:MAG: VOC family protein [Deinococcota bacterium]